MAARSEPGFLASNCGTFPTAIRGDGADAAEMALRLTGELLAEHQIEQLPPLIIFDPGWGSPRPPWDTGLVVDAIRMCSETANARPVSTHKLSRWLFRRRSKLAGGNRTIRRQCRLFIR